MSKAQLIMIGDELLIGQVIDTNGPFIANKFNEIGLEIVRKISVNDSFKDLRWAFSNTQNAKIIISTGGLGPTRDDLTKNFLCEFFDDQLAFNEEVHQHLQRLSSERKRPLNKLTKNQAYVPSKALLLPNIHGTAPGLWMEKKGKIFICLPGVPFEMRHLLIQEVMPRLKKRFERLSILHRTLIVTQLTESALAEKIQDWELALPENIKLAYLPSAERVRLRLSGKGEEAKILEEQLQKAIGELSQLIGPYILSYQDESIEKMIGAILKKKQLTLATAESCTGGSIAAKIVSIAGSSNYYKGSIIAYDSQTKTECLDIDPTLIQKHGAVSKEVAGAMAAGAKEKLKTSLALATSGLSGPGKGEELKDVGTLCIGLAVGDKIYSQELHLGPGERAHWIEKASVKALEYLYRHIC